MSFEKRFPRRVTAILAIFQTILTAAIIGLEFGSFYNDVAHGTIWAGFWSSIVFISTFIMMFIISVCCGTYVLILNILSGLLACVIIYFNAYFINNPCKCYLGDHLCCALRDINSFNSFYGNIVRNCSIFNSNGVQTVTDYCQISSQAGKLTFLKAQIGCAVGMLVVCAVYIVTYFMACVTMCFKRD